MSRKKERRYLLSHISSEETFKQILDLHHQLLSTFERCTGISASRMQVLFHVYHSKEISQTALKKLVGIDHAAITRHLKQLEGENMVIRRTSPEDNRFTLVKLSENGRQQIETLNKEREQFLNQMQLGFGEQELKQLSAMLQRIKHNLVQL
ncbi:transcriptional regulator [Salipaludibacillus neizhouensis]|uniref:Transcriptional regulator n=2 Tax=Salipaludibacillus neizhouensis TaxID=885475 RepID=A0A3A9K2U4_9BACI|nr:transcriptional regulator [Salipaludibacillus neizhouensis]